MRKEKVDIIYCVSHGFALRMLLQTDLVGKLSATNKIAIVGPHLDEKYMGSDRNENIQFIDFRPKSSRVLSYLNKFRTYFLEDIKNNIALREKHLLKCNSTRFSERTTYRFLGFVNSIFRKVSWLKKLYSFVEQKFYQSQEAEELLMALEPRLVISTYPVHFSEGLLLAAAKKKNILSTIHLLSWDNISCKGRFPVLADNYIAWGEVMKEELKAYYSIPEDKISICGVPHFDLHKRHIKNQHVEWPFNDIPVGSKVILFAMSAPRFAPKEIDIVEWLAHSINNDSFGEEVYLIVRPHPQNVQGSMADLTWIERLKKLPSKKVKLDLPKLEKSELMWQMKKNDMVEMSDKLIASSLCLNSGSTMSIDALAANTPVAITSFDANFDLPYWSSATRLKDFPHLKKFISIGDIPVSLSFDELDKEIREQLKKGKKLSEGMLKTYEMHCGNPANDATEQVLNQIRTLLN